jgi:urease accessory protein
MVFEKIIGGRGYDGASGRQPDLVRYEWFEQNAKVLKKLSDSGIEVALRLSEPLFDGAVILDDENGLLVLSLLPCEIIRASVTSIREMGRLCFELGNRHLPLYIGENHVDTPFDSPTFLYLIKLGFSCERLTEKFVPEVIVRGHGH